MHADERERLAIAQFLARLDDRSFTQVFDVLYPRVFRYFRVRGLERTLAEELSQNVFLTVFRRGNQVREPERFRAWLFRVAKNEWLQHERRSHTMGRSAQVDTLDNHAELPDPASMQRETTGFEELVKPLNESEREILTLRFVDGFGYQEIADLLEMPIGTVKWKISNARDKLAGIYETAGRKNP